jgi:uncharacterized YigZ family protein|tara:strand:- start:4752 stop:5366 length:615 start_codon:yes stop_codon:yes gene_type:complete
LDTKTKYRSVKKSEPYEHKEKGSKFIGLAAWVKTEQEIKEVLDNWHEAHPQATHICYAYRLGIEGEVYRANDDGEPNNSAGAPILGQLISADVTNTIVGVVRYYGGIKLGVGGLISAYKEAAKQVLSQSKIMVFKLNKYYELAITYLDMPHVMAVLKRNQIDILNNTMTNECLLEVKLSIDDERDIKELLSRFEGVKIKDLGIK